jgi:transposase-like protein
LKHAEDATLIGKMYRKSAISNATFHPWRKKYDGLLPIRDERLRQCEEQNAKQKRLVADLSLKKAMLQNVVARKLCACSVAAGDRIRPYVRAEGAWKYWYLAVDKAGAMMAFPLTVRWDHKAVLRFRRDATSRYRVPKKITNDKSGVNTAAIIGDNADHDTNVEIHKAKYFNNIVEQNHRAIKRRVRAKLKAKAVWSAAIAGIEIMYMISKVNCDRPESCVGPRVQFVGGIRSGFSTVFSQLENFRQNQPYTA